MSHRTVSSRLLLLVLLAPACLAAAACAQESSLSPFDVGWDDRELYREGLIAAEQGVLDDLPGATVYHIELHIPRAMDVLQGRQEFRYTNQEDVPLDEIVLRLYPNVTGGKMTLSGVRVDGEAVAHQTEGAESVARIALPSALSPGAQVVVELGFQVEVAREMGGNYGLFGFFENVLVLDELYPVVAMYDERGWDDEIPARNGDLTHLDASFYLVRVHVPRGVTVVASGVEVDRARQAREMAFTYAAGPARDFYVAASDRFVAVDEQVGETTVRSYALQGHKGSAELAAGNAAAALRHMSARFGPYPYSEFEVVSTPMRALGMEYPGVVAITLRVYDPGATVSGLPAQVMMESVIAHEVGHQWFYNLVGNDQQDEPWLDEAVVQYATGLYFLDQYGPQGAESYRASWQDRWDRVSGDEIPIGLPSGDYTGDQYSPIVYGRGPFFVQALAAEMGEETFDAFIRDYAEVYRWQVSSTEGFRALAEQHCGCDLGPLFRDWVYENREGLH